MLFFTHFLGNKSKFVLELDKRDLNSIPLFRLPSVWLPGVFIAERWAPIYYDWNVTTASTKSKKRSAIVINIFLSERLSLKIVVIFVFEYTTYINIICTYFFVSSPIPSVQDAYLLRYIFFRHRVQRSFPTQRTKHWNEIQRMSSSLGVQNGTRTKLVIKMGSSCLVRWWRIFSWLGLRWRNCHRHNEPARITKLGWPSNKGCDRWI